MGSFNFLYQFPILIIQPILYSFQDCLILAYPVAFKSLSAALLSEDSCHVQCPTKNISLPLPVTYQTQLDHILKRKVVTQG